MASRVTFWLAALILSITMLGTTLPTPLYVIYQAQWHFSAAIVTVTFAVYAVAVLATLLLAGRSSDQAGRKPVLATALAASALRFCVDGDVAAVGGGQRSRDRQAEPGAATGAAPGTISPVEALGNVRGLFRSHAGPVIRDDDLPGPGGTDHGHGDRRLRRGVLGGIADQVVDDLAQPFGIGVHDDRVTGPQRDRAVRVDDASGLDRLCRDAGQVEVVPVQGAVGIEFGQHEEVLHQPPHPAGLVLDEGHQPEQFPGTGRVALLQAELSQPADRRQWGAQLMAGVRDELPHPFFGSERTRLALRACLVRGLDPAERRQAGPHKRQPEACQHRDRDRPSQRIRYLQASDGAVEIIEANPMTACARRRAVRPVPARNDRPGSPAR